jgi:hypothetical protein
MSGGVCLDATARSHKARMILKARPFLCRGCTQRLEMDVRYSENG